MLFATRSDVFPGKIRQERLLSTNDSIREISESLGFPTQSFFGKYFKRVIGMTPKEYRQGRKLPER